MIRRLLPALPLFALALAAFPLGPVLLVAQTLPSRVPRPSPLPRPSPPVPPVPPVTEPARPAPPARTLFGHLDDAIMEARVSGLFDAQRAAQAALSTTFDRLRDIDFPSLAAMAPLVSIPPFDIDLSGLRFASGFQSGSYRDDWRVSSRPPEAWDKDDPADSLYREARRALSSDAYRKAAELFRRIRDQYPKSAYTPDAPYWEAFALQRLGNESDLRAAQDALTWQQKQFPKAATRGDAMTLATRIDGALARRGDREAYSSLLVRVNQTTSQGCPRDDDDERVTALNALARMDSAQFLPVIKKALTRREPCTQGLRRTAVWLYARSKATDAPQVLMNVAKTDPDKDVREQAVFWMANVPTDEAAAMLIDLARNGTDLDLRKRAVYALSRSRSARSASTLREIAVDGSAPTELRSDALQWYMNGPGRTAADAMTFLKDVYGKADEQHFRERVLQIIANRKTDDTREFLTAVAQNNRESIDTRRQALYALQNAGATSAQIAAIYDKSANDIEIRKQAIGVLAGLRDGAGIDKLLDVARSEKNSDLRKQAVSYLARTKDPRAMALLQEIIDR